jgi:diaminopimelate epimerase
VQLAFLKGHGTENDFVLVPDGSGALALTPAMVRAICDRRAGIGGDGVLRAVLTANVDAGELATLGIAPADAAWFMDYRNADGSIAEMCGNGARLFARYLVDAGLMPPGAVRIATRAGVVGAHAGRTGDVRVGLGPYAQLDTPALTVTVDDGTARDGGWPAVGVAMPNPHAVAMVGHVADAGRLYDAPVVTPTEAFPEGVNVEFVARVGERHVAMRVHERGVGETRSCGTGACAVAVACAQVDGVLPETDGEPVAYTVDVPGGRLRVTVRPDGLVDLEGPAVLVAEGTINLPEA